MGSSPSPRRAQTRRLSPWAEFLIGALLLAACFAGLCGYAAHQRGELQRALDVELPAAPVAQR